MVAGAASGRRSGSGSQQSKAWVSSTSSDGLSRWDAKPAQPDPAARDALELTVPLFVHLKARAGSERETLKQLLHQCVQQGPSTGPEPLGRSVPALLPRLEERLAIQTYQPLPHSSCSKREHHGPPARFKRVAGIGPGR